MCSSIKHSATEETIYYSTEATRRIAELQAEVERLTVELAREIRERYSWVDANIILHGEKSDLLADNARLTKRCEEARTVIENAGHRICSDSDALHRVNPPDELIEINQWRAGKP